ncbi:MAG: N-6 DNA methylase, partial [Deltaproteobacteria bacterium]|nr:N-6 DNA methylase [Deltaproteobacteria bacterium]
TTVQALIERTLFIKFLEDNHIINSYFYNHYFNDSKTGYKKFLKNNEINNINKLFGSINEIFNNILFKETIDKNRLTPEILKSIYDMISQKDFKTGQLNLFDFQFNIMPIEFIGRIYEVFLEKKQLKAGIFYTPQNLAQLIIDYTIKKKGSILDPSCGSGIFLNFAFRKLLEIEKPKSDIPIEIIEHSN